MVDDVDALKAAEVAKDAYVAAVVAAEQEVPHAVFEAWVAGASAEALKAAEAGSGAPPVDDAHVAVGSSLFSDPTKLKEAPIEVGSVYLGHIGEPAVEGKDF